MSVPLIILTKQQIEFLKFICDEFAKGKYYGLRFWYSQVDDKSPDHEWGFTQNELVNRLDEIIRLGHIKRPSAYILTMREILNMLLKEKRIWVREDPVYIQSNVFEIDIEHPFIFKKDE